MSLMTRRAKSRIKRTFRRLGIDVGRHANSLSRIRMNAFRRTRVELVFDVGANVGQYVQLLRDSGYGGRIVSFEPLPAAYERLITRAKRDRRWEPIRVALGDRDGTVQIHVSANLVSSSVLPMLERHVSAEPRSKYVGTEPARLARLDSLAPSYLVGIESFWIKLDVQGFELQVLSGAEQTLSRASGVEAEVSFVPLYKDQVLFDEMREYIESRGFVLSGIESGFTDPTSGQLLQADAIFLRVPSGESSSVATDRIPKETS